MLVTSIVLSVWLAGGSAGKGAVVGLPLTGEEAVEFLQTAAITSKPEAFDSLAITKPVRVTLSDGRLEARAIFKDEDTFHLTFRFADNRVLMQVKDSYKHEIAAYELDRMLGLDIVPPCVERTIRSQTGSLCLWVEDATTEAERIGKKLRPPSIEQWNRQMYTIRLFHQLIWDPDYNNTRNLLVDSDFKLYKVDSSLSFRKDRRLRSEQSLNRFSRRVLAALEAMDRDRLQDRLGRWLDKAQLEALWQRRCRLLELAAERVEEQGEAEVLFE